MAEQRQNLWLMRHGETEWSLSGKHTSRTDLPLTANGEASAEGLGKLLGGHSFALVLCSPLQRARVTCRLAGLGSQAQIDEDLVEWDYGNAEGLSTPEMQVQRPGWSLWKNGVTGGETVEDVAVRARRVIDRAAAVEGDVALFGHGHILRILTACWLGLPADCGRLFALATGTVSVLGYERETRVISRWNQV